MSRTASSTGRASRCARASTSFWTKKLPDNAEQRPTLSCRRKQRAPSAQRALQAPIEGALLASLREEARERGVVGERVVTRIARAQHADVARDARGEHRRADARGLADHVRAAFH